MDGRQTVWLTRSRNDLPRIQRCEREPLPRSWARAVMLAWPLLFVLMVAIAPEPADPEAVPSLLDSLVFLGFIIGLVGTTAAAFTRHASALLWSIGLGVLWVATAIACPVSGHHDAAGWQWRLELVLSGALLALSVVGWRRLRTR